ncbi:MAG: ribonuclease E/G [Oscillospiraceae bacterium]|jgi:ribonuclease G|nr:ribonuclease E/G [Oscillospiraceae bacterium]
MMPERRVLLDQIGLQTRRLVIEDGRPVEFAVEYKGSEPLVGNLYVARVEQVLRGMQAAFVDIGMGKNAFLSLDDLPSAARDLGDAPRVRRAAPLKPGQEIIVQVVKEPGGSKGPRVTMNPSFPGKYAVLLPTVEAVGVSRRIEDPAMREGLLLATRAACPAGMGLIARTLAAEATPELLAEEAFSLQSAWQALSQAARTRKAPALLWDEAGLVARTERDFGMSGQWGAWDDALETALRRDLRRQVWLPCGGFLVFDRCEAMTVIDVNSGKFVGKKQVEDTMLRLNREAAVEIARQIRLRDIGGIIVVDFVDMKSEENRQSVFDAFAQAMAGDRAKHHLHGFTAAGLCELTRRSVYRSVQSALQMPCPACEGTGFVQTPEAEAHDLLREVRRRRLAGDGSVITLAVAGEVREALMQAGLPPGVALA